MTRNSFPLIISNTLIAEDVRQEMHGKHSVLGIYSGDLLVQELVGVMRLALYAEIRVKEVAEYKASIIILFRKIPIIMGDFVFNFQQINDPAIIMIPSFALPLEGAGYIDVDVACNGQTKRIMHREVRKADVLAIFSTAPGQPSAQSRPARRTKAKRP